MGFFSRLADEYKNQRRIQDEQRRIDEICRATYDLLNDDDLQNDLLPQFLKQFMKPGKIIDPNVYNGLYGRSVNYPIRVNGPLGELTYLSKLVVAKTGAPLMFHRLGSVEHGIDVYEVISKDGSMYDLLYFDMYYQYKSKFAPSGYSFAKQVIFLGGVDSKVDNFPQSICDVLYEYTEKRFGLPFVNSILEESDFDFLKTIIAVHRNKNKTRIDNISNL